MTLEEYIPTLPRDFVDKVAKLVKIPKDEVPSFTEGLDALFHVAREEHAKDLEIAEMRKVVSKQLDDLRKLATKLKECFSALDSTSRERLGLYALVQPIISRSNAIGAHMDIPRLVNDGDIEQAERVVASYTIVIDEMIAAASTREWAVRGGRPSKWFDEPGGQNVMAFDIFVLNLVRLIRSHGGKEKLEKNAGTGSLVDCLNLARPHLPAGLIPRGYSMSRLQRLRGAATPMVVLCSGPPPSF